LPLPYLLAAMFGGPLQTGMCKPCPILSSGRTAAVKGAAAETAAAPAEKRRTVRGADLPPQRAQLQDMLLGLAKDNKAAMIRKLITEQQLIATYGNAIGQTPLHVAAVWNSTDAGKVLLELGADVNAQNEMNAATPLHMGAMRGRREFCALLLERGADPTLALADWRIAAEMVESDRSLAASLLEAAERWQDSPPSGGGSAEAAADSEEPVDEGVETKEEEVAA
jgi:hypothetical protein